MACGFSLKEGKLEEFRSRVTPELKKYEQKIQIDAKLNLDDITPELQDFIKKMKPFRRGNPPPIFQVDDVNYKISNGVPILFNREDVLSLDTVKEMPPPSEGVNAYLRLNGDKIHLLKWEWVEDEK